MNDFKIDIVSSGSASSSCRECIFYLPTEGMNNRCVAIESLGQWDRAELTTCISKESTNYQLVHVVSGQVVKPEAIMRQFALSD